MRSKRTRTDQIRSHALHLGFDACGFARAQHLDEEARRLEEWLIQKRQASMHWMENHFDKRVDPSLLVPGAKTVISVIASYYHPSHRDLIGQKHIPQIAKYAQGRDYHKVFKKKLRELYAYINEEIGEVPGRAFVDSAPVLDKVWAQRAGLGWIGKNSNLLNKKAGSYFLIGELILDIELSYDTPVTDHCGSCTRCIDACPTDAIYEPYRVDSSRCISYWTIEHKGSIPQSYHQNFENWVFGCDICQDVCPWNSKAVTAQFHDLHPRGYVLEKSLTDFEQLDKASFNRLFEGSALRRTKYERFQRNLGIVKKNLENL